MLKKIENWLPRGDEKGEKIPTASVLALVAFLQAGCDQPGLTTQESEIVRYADRLCERIVQSSMNVENEDLSSRVREIHVDYLADLAKERGLERVETSLRSIDNRFSLLDLVYIETLLSGGTPSEARARVRQTISGRMSPVRTLACLQAGTELLENAQGRIESETKVDAETLRIIEDYLTLNEAGRRPLASND